MRCVTVRAVVPPQQHRPITTQRPITTRQDANITNAMLSVTTQMHNTTACTTPHTAQHDSMHHTTQCTSTHSIRCRLTLGSSCSWHAVCLRPPCHRCPARLNMHPPHHINQIKMCGSADALHGVYQHPHPRPNPHPLTHRPTPTHTHPHPHTPTRPNARAAHSAEKGLQATVRVCGYGCECERVGCRESVDRPGTAC